MWIILIHFHDRLTPGVPQEKCKTWILTDSDLRSDDQLNRSPSSDPGPSM